MDSEVGKHSATFIQKLWMIVNDYEQREDEKMIRWSSNGKSMVVNNSLFERRMTALYPGFMKSSNVKSFKKRLNTFGFRANEQSKCK